MTEEECIGIKQIFKMHKAKTNRHKGRQKNPELLWEASLSEIDEIVRWKINQDTEDWNTTNH